MDQVISIQSSEAISEIRYLPEISIIMPFQPIVTSKQELEYKLMLITAKIEQELGDIYSAEYAVPATLKLRRIVQNLNYNSYKKSIAIFISPVVEKVYYLDIEVKENMVVNGSFKMQDIVLNKKQTPQYLTMILAGESSKLYEGNSSGFSLIKSNVSKNPLHNFLEEMDNGLFIILKAYPIPVFIIAPKAVLENFKKITKNDKNVIEYITVCSDVTGDTELRNIILPYESNWENLKQTYLLNQVEKAYEEDKLVTGIENVLDKAIHCKGRLLIIEKKFLTPKAHVKAKYCNNKGYFIENLFYIKDEVDEIIEKVLENGGDVELIDNNLLSDYEQIVLIKN